MPGNAADELRTFSHGDALTSKPVSYTHLDVYKRQGKTVCFLVSGGLSAGRLFCGTCRRGEAVSYTHLDVYKRQISEQQAVAMIDPRNLDTLLHPQFDPKALKAGP